MNLKQKSLQYPQTSGIYKITNPKGQVYIGQTVNFQQRYYYYLTAPFKDQPRIKESFNEFGDIEKHKFDIVEQCPINKLDEKELYWGLFYDVLGDNGLNCRLGHGKGNLRESTKDLIREKLTGKKQSEYTINKRREKLTGQKRNNETCSLMKEKKIGFEITWGDKISNSKKLNPYVPTSTHIENVKKALCIPILQFDKQNNFIKEYSSAAEAEKHIGVKRDNICSVLKGKSKTAGGYIWKYKE